MKYALALGMRKSCNCLEIIINPLSALMTYTYMSWYMLDKNWCKIGSSKDFLKNFFLFACIIKGASAEKKTGDV